MPSRGLAQSAGCLALLPLLLCLLWTRGARQVATAALRHAERRKARGPDTVETNEQEEDPWGPALMNGCKQFVYTSRFMGLVPLPGLGHLLMCMSRGRCKTSLSSLGTW